jgi:hypothetical protein
MQMHAYTDIEKIPCLSICAPSLQQVAQIIIIPFTYQTSFRFTFMLRRT